MGGYGGHGVLHEGTKNTKTHEEETSALRLLLAWPVNAARSLFPSCVFVLFVPSCELRALRYLPANDLRLCPYVLEINRLPIDPAQRRGDVVRELAGFVDGLGHDAEEILAVLHRRQPFVLAASPLLGRE
jgi:hypothetical protein